LTRRLVRYPDLRDHGVILSRRQIDRLEAKGAFPRRVKISDRCVAWVQSEIAEYVESLIRERPARPEKKR
jgi:prophage regulatory protein